MAVMNGAEREPARPMSPMAVPHVQKSAVTRGMS
jgi:hypothetical protein